MRKRPAMTKATKSKGKNEVRRVRSGWGVGKMVGSDFEEGRRNKQTHLRGEEVVPSEVLRSGQICVHEDDFEFDIILFGRQDLRMDPSANVLILDDMA